ncbi:heme peroxidase [Obelidium mucronatum]|nr:heme peroxidase [Obelidium mucronatum]
MLPILALSIAAAFSIAAVAASCPYADMAAKRSQNWNPYYTPSMTPMDWYNLKQDINAAIISPGFGPLIVRLAWHDAGTYSLANGLGGPHAQQRFAPVINYAADAGLQPGRDFMEPMKAKYPGISYADLWSFAGAVVISNSGGPTIRWRPGRADALDSSDDFFPDGTLPDALDTPSNLRTLFHAKGFSDREIVALSGGHNLGSLHPENTRGWSGQWTTNPRSFGNEFFVRLTNQNAYTVQNGGLFVDTSNSALVMLPSDMALVQDPTFAAIVQEYASNQGSFYADFSAAFSKLLELGVGSGLGNAVDTSLSSGPPQPPPPPPPSAATSDSSQPQTTNDAVKTSTNGDSTASSVSKTTGSSSKTMAATTAIPASKTIVATTSGNVFVSLSLLSALLVVAFL